MAHADHTCLNPNIAKNDGEAGYDKIMAMHSIMAQKISHNASCNDELAKYILTNVLKYFQNILLNISFF